MRFLPWGWVVAIAGPILIIIINENGVFRWKIGGKRQNKGFTDAFFGHFEPKGDTAENYK